jgi:uncharacterized membrane protein YqhA
VAAASKYQLLVHTVCLVDEVLVGTYVTDLLMMSLFELFVVQIHQQSSNL